MENVPPRSEDLPSDFDLFIKSMENLSEAEQKHYLIDACRLRFDDDTVECEVEIIGPSDAYGMVKLTLYLPGGTLNVPMSRKDAVGIWERLGEALGNPMDVGEKNSEERNARQVRHRNKRQRRQ